MIAGGGLFMLTQAPFRLFGKNPEVKIVILNTNDTHSRMEPFPMDGGRNQGLGGVAARSKIINQIRNEEKNVLLFDSGDIFQGTPYFNFFGGEIEFKAMTEMGYDAATIGNHDFDGGIEKLNDNLKFADFDFIISNYDFSNTPMEGKTIKNKVYEINNVKIGVYGLGIELDGLVPDELFGKTKYLDPVKAAIEQEKYLTEKEKCDFVICLSHLGYKYDSDKVSDHVIAQNTSKTNLILGGHTHTFLDEAEKVINNAGDECHIFQVGWAGINLGRTELIFSKTNNTKKIKSSILKIN